MYEALEQEGGAEKFMLASGYSGRDAKGRHSIDPSLPFVQEPWNLTELLVRVRSVLDDKTAK